MTLSGGSEMNKAEFLRALDNALCNLPESERREHIE